MPFEPVVKHTELEHSFRLHVSCDVELDITDATTDFEKSLSNFPLAGNWRLGAGWDDDELCIEMEHGEDVPEGVFGANVHNCITLEWIDGERRGVVSKATWDGHMPRRNPVDGEVFPGRRLSVSVEDREEAAQASGGYYKPETHRSYRCTFTLQQAYPEDETAAHGSVLEGLARRTAGLNLEQLPHNVRLFFPRAHKDGAELWVKGEILSRSSPYLKDLLASDFAEAQPRRSKRARTSGAVEAVPAVQQEKDFDDSDDETDDFLFSKEPPSLSQSSEADDISFRQITVTQSAFSTYHAVLVYLQTGFIHFKPLSSSFPLSEPVCATRRDFLSAKWDEDSSLPHPVSPKSAYRLAHLLQLEDLQKRALGAVRTSLTVNGAATELFSDFSSLYEDARKVTIDFVVKNRKEVEASAAYKDIGARMKARDAALAHAGAIWFELAEAQAAAAAAAEK
ncbi:hypothetical protein JCM10213_003861 [Rhodosporidiobolus nylandii]